MQYETRERNSFLIFKDRMIILFCVIILFRFGLLLLKICYDGIVFIDYALLYYLFFSILFIKNINNEQYFLLYFFEILIFPVILLHLA